VRLDASSWLDLSFFLVFVLTWGCVAIRRKKLAPTLAWWWITASVILGFLLFGQKQALPQTRDLTTWRHFVGSYVPVEIKQFSLVQALVHVLLWKAFPVDLRVLHLAAVQGVAIWVYSLLFAVFFFGYLLSKRHYAQTASALAHLSRQEREERFEELSYRERQAALEIKTLEKQEKSEELAYKREQITVLLEKDKLALEKERLAVEVARLDLEKKRAEYVLELARLLIDTLYTGSGSVETRTELLRQTLPALKDFGQRESTTLILEHLEGLPDEIPPAIPAVAQII
jgi:hypothetical protein